MFRACLASRREALYRLNTLRSVISLMYRRHVYREASRITPAFIAKKQGVARRRDDAR